MKIELFRNRIRFEAMVSCGCGNGGQHQHAALAAYESAVSDAIEAAKHEAEVALGYDQESGRFRVCITPEPPRDEDGDALPGEEPMWVFEGGRLACVLPARNAAAPVPADVAAALQIASAADAAGLEAAEAAYERDCTDEAEML